MNSEISKNDVRSLLRSSRRLAPLLFVLGIMTVGWLAVHNINTGGTSHQKDEFAEEPAIENTLRLPAGKLAAADLNSVPAQSQPVQHVHTVPGRIRYEESKHVDVKAPMDGILTQVSVTPGERVERGQLLAVIKSPEIGSARADVLKRKKELEIAQRQSDRETELATNIGLVSAMVDQRLPVSEIDAQFAGKSLGTYREQLLGAYARMLLAIASYENIAQLEESGIVSGRVMHERETEKQVAEAEFQSAREEAVVNSSKANLKSEAAVAQAERLLGLAKQNVEALLGYQDNEALEGIADDDSLSRLEVRAPFAGSIESRAFACDERVSRTDSLVVLANTDSLYVAADIREGDWSAVSLKKGTKVLVTVPALEDRAFEAHVHYTGTEVSAASNSVPLVAIIDNRQGLLRPGMFVRVSIPSGPIHNTLSVKPESVIHHDNQQFVFVDNNDGTFKRVDVSTGVASDEWIEVTDGLSPGQLVVTKGAFVLKSEMLLQGEIE